MLTIKVAELGQASTEVTLENSATAADAIRAASKSSEGKAIRRNGKDISADTTLRDGDVLVLVPSVKGGRS